jgi:hypothetical protein
VRVTVLYLYQQHDIRTLYKASFHTVESHNGADLENVPHFVGPSLGRVQLAAQTLRIDIMTYEILYAQRQSKQPRSKNVT